MVNILREIVQHYKKRKDFKKRKPLYQNRSNSENFRPFVNSHLKDFTLVRAISAIALGALSGFTFFSVLLSFEKKTLLVFIGLLSLSVIGFVHFNFKKYKKGLLILLWVGFAFVGLAMLVGKTSTTFIQNKPVLVNSTADKTYKLANGVLSDLLTLEDNQKLLRLSLSEARGVPDLYIKASKQSAYISKKWNPALAKNLPAPGLMEVYVKINKAADQQSEALALFYNLLQQQDSNSLEKLKLLEASYMELMYGSDGAVNSLKKAVSPFGIVLEVPNERQ